MDGGAVRGPDCAGSGQEALKKRNLNLRRHPTSVAEMPLPTAGLLRAGDGTSSLLENPSSSARSTVLYPEPWRTLRCRVLLFSL